jgi:hypothetical protein
MKESTYMRMRCHDWKRSGRIWLWRYVERNRNYLGWHLSADAAGRDALIALVDAFVTDGADATRAMNIDTLDATAGGINFRQIGNVVTPKKWRITVAKDDTWRFPETGEYAELQVGESWLPRLRKGFTDICNPIGDYCIGGSKRGNVPLWFW